MQDVSISRMFFVVLLQLLYMIPFYITHTNTGLYHMLNATYFLFAHLIIPCDEL